MVAVKAFLSIGECMIEMSRNDAGDWNMGFAGDTLNTAWYARACLPAAAWRVDYFTRLGEDRYSAMMLEFFQGAGIGTGHIVRDSKRLPGLYLIELDNGERSFTYWRSRSAARKLADDEDLLAAAIRDAHIIYFSGITLAILARARRAFLLQQVRQARAAGKTTAFDPNIRFQLWKDTASMRDAVMEAARGACVVMPSFEDESAAFGDRTLQDCARRYLDAGAGEVVVKNAGGPVCIATADFLTTAGTPETVRPVDTTGAGDSFNGAYLAARAQGSDHLQAVGRAQRLAGRVIRHRGALVARGAIAGEA